MLYLVMDANFHLKCCDCRIKNDPELLPGTAYLVHSKQYAEVMEMFGDQEEVHK